MLNTSPICYLPLKHPSPCSYIAERRSQGPQTAGLNYWVTDASLFVIETLSLKQCKRKKSISCHLCSSSLAPDNKSLSYVSSWTPHGRDVCVHSSWGMRVLCSPCRWLRIKTTFLFPPKALMGREGQDFGQQYHHLSFQTSSGFYWNRREKLKVTKSKCSFFFFCESGNVI